MRIPPIASVIFYLMLAAPTLAHASVYDAWVFPEDANDGWVRHPQVNLADRFLDNGWLIQSCIALPCPPHCGTQDYYHRSVADHAAYQAWYLEWTMLTDGIEDFAAVAPSSISAANESGVYYHFTIASDRVRFLRHHTVPLVFVDVEPMVNHTYRLELHGLVSYAFFIDGRLIDSGIPIGFPDSLLDSGS